MELLGVRCTAEKNINLNISLAGGAFPFTVGRIEHGYNVRPDLCATECKISPRKFLGKFYTDALVHDARALDLLVDVIGEVCGVMSLRHITITSLCSVDPETPYYNGKLEFTGLNNVFLILIQFTDCRLTDAVLKSSIKSILSAVSRKISSCFIWQTPFLDPW